MGTLTFDFAFIENSLLHGEFLIDIYGNYPDVRIQNVAGMHKAIPNTVFLSVTVPEDIATLLKLRYGQHIVQRYSATADLIAQIDELRKHKIQEFDNLTSLKHPYIDFDYFDEEKKSAEDVILMKLKFVK